MRITKRVGYIPPEEAARELRDIKRFGILAIGKGPRVKFLKGLPISLHEAVASECYHCSGFYRDGKSDCLNPRCTLYPWMPYRGRQPPSEGPCSTLLEGGCVKPLPTGNSSASRPLSNPNKPQSSKKNAQKEVA